MKVAGQTGVEMEALTAVAVACLTIYDMVKAVDRGMRIEGIRLVEKRGGRSGHYRAGGVKRGGVAVGRRGARTRARARRPAAGRTGAARPRPTVACSRYPLKALRTQPPADVSAMDGYAVRAADVANAPARLKIIGEVAAGRPFAHGSVPARRRAFSPAACCRRAPTPS